MSAPDPGGAWDEGDPPPARQPRRRASGKTAGEEVAEEQAEELTAPPDEAVTPEERREDFTALNFARMRLEWRGEDAEMLHRIRVVVDSRIFDEFSDAFAAVYEAWDSVRDMVVDPATGETRVDAAGNPIYVRLPGGAYKEDWTRLTFAQREDLLFKITTGLFDWQQRAADLWAEAMFAKAIWTEQFARHFDAGRGTVDARTATANISSSESRYFALFVSYLSRRADAVVASMQGIGQRLKDTLVNG